MKFSCIFILLSILLTAAPLNTWAADSEATQQWIHNAYRDGVRFVWAYTFPDGNEKKNPNMIGKLEDHIAMMKTCGINMLGVGYPLLRNAKFSSKPVNGKYFQAFEQVRVDHIRKIIRTAKKENIAVMVILQTYKEDYVKIIKDKNYRKVVDMLGSTGGVLACPADESFWWGMEVPRMELVARLIHEEGAVGGILFETEAYLARKFYPGYGSQKTMFCYCDHCFAKFMKTVGINEKLPAKTERYEWLCRKGLDGKYQKYMEDVYAKTYGSIFRYLRKRYPDTLGGLYQLGVEPNSDGFAKGVATDKLPALLFSSSEYFCGYDREGVTGFSNVARSSDFQTHINSLNSNVWFLCGLITGPYWPKQYAAELNLILRRADGYWMYDASIFFKDAKKVVTKDPNNQSQYRLKATPEEFWAEIKKANQARPQRKQLPLTPTQYVAINTDFNRIERKQIKEAQTQSTRIATDWECDGVNLHAQKGIYCFAPDKPIEGKRTRYVEAMFKGNLQLGAIYGFTVNVSNPDSKSSNWINLGYSRNPPYPVFYDTNILVRPKVNKEYSFVITPKEKWGKDYWIRFGARNGSFPIYIKPSRLERLYEVQFISTPVIVPQAQKITLGISKSDSVVFRFEYDLVSCDDGKVLMANCNENTDISGLAYIDVKKVIIKVRLLTRIANQPKKCPLLVWNLFDSK